MGQNMKRTSEIKLRYKDGGQRHFTFKNMESKPSDLQEKRENQED